ncbi:hypothetical protein T484DRAFT_3628580 [Baffinella frigidus]|nr:hypothetical protein T484DRAFT_3628580 [Cryptophyta sp. CCMP2293]
MSDTTSCVSPPNQPMNSTSDLSVDAALQQPFGCMVGYHTLHNTTETERDMIAAMQECLAKLTSAKYITRVTGELRVVHTSMRILQFFDSFNSFEGQKVRAGPGMRAPTENCECDAEAHPLVSVSGCVTCFIDWPTTVHKCPCDTLTIDSTGGRYAKTGCMHPGDWDSELVMQTFEKHSLCLVCGVFHTDTTTCEHRDLLDDVSYFEDSIPWSPGGRYKRWLVCFLAKDKATKKQEDSANDHREQVARILFDMKRKAACLETQAGDE